MVLDISTVVPVVSLVVLSFIYLVVRYQRETNLFIDDLQSHLRRRTIAHNRSKAQTAILKTKNTKMNQQIRQLEDEVSQFRAKALSFAEDQSHRNQEVERLEMEISTIREVIDSDIKSHLNEYIQQVDGLRSRLKKVKSIKLLQLVKK